MAPDQPGRFHNRLTHSLEVARIGQALTRGLLERPGGQEAAAKGGGLDPAVVEAACLAHDLGHPPFGHDAEDELNHLLTTAGVADGFEANAQSFRVVTKLAHANDDGHGMNLTRATLAAILKYPWQRGASATQPDKWGAYASEATDLAWATALALDSPPRPSLEAEVMDWADLVAYAVLDFEDFTRAGLIPLERLASIADERERFLELVCQRRSIPPSGHSALSSSLERLLTGCTAPRLSAASRQGRNALRCFCHRQIDDAINGVAFAPSGHTSWLTIAPATRRSVYLLEGLTWHYVIAGDLLKSQRDGQRQIIRDLFNRLADTSFASDRLNHVQTTHRAQLEATDNDPARLRVVADVIASMREDEAMARL